MRCIRIKKVGHFNLQSTFSRLCQERAFRWLEKLVFLVKIAPKSAQEEEACLILESRKGMTFV